MNKKTLFLVLSVILCLVLIITGIIAGQKGTQSEDGTETPKPPVTLTPPQTETLSPSVDTQSPETLPPPLYAGKTFTVLVPNSGDLLLGDSMGGDTVSEAVYGRNIAVCRNTGVTMLFKYSLDVYADLQAASHSGISAPDLIMLNMLSDGSRFLMNGGLLDVSELYASEKGLDNAFSDSMGVAGKQYFILGDLTPSCVSAQNFLKIRSDSVLLTKLSGDSQNTTLTYEELFSVLTENETQLSLDEYSLHALISDGLFSLSNDGEASVDYDGYVKRVTALSAYSSGIDQRTETDPEITVGAYSGDGYVYLPLPSVDGENDGHSVDMSRIFPFALPSGCPDRTMSDAVLFELISLSEGFCELAAKEYKLPIAVNAPAYCFYDIFGWGDFSKHAYKAFVGNKTGSLSKTLEAPKKASVQALLILFERNS